MRRGAAACLLLCVVGCGASRPSEAVDRAAARAFAEDVVAGDVGGAQSHVASDADAAAHEQTTRLSAAFAHGSAHLIGEGRGRETSRWEFAYTKRVNGKNGAFSRERGVLVVDTAGRTPGVTFAAIVGRQTLYSTHHDSELLPSKR